MYLVYVRWCHIFFAEFVNELNSKNCGFMGTKKPGVAFMKSRVDFCVQFPNPDFSWIDDQINDIYIIIYYTHIYIYCIHIIYMYTYIYIYLYGRMKHRPLLRSTSVNSFCVFDGGCSTSKRSLVGRTTRLPQRFVWVSTP